MSCGSSKIWILVPAWSTKTEQFSDHLTRKIGPLDFKSLISTTTLIFSCLRWESVQWNKQTPKTDWGKNKIPQVNSQERIHWYRDCKQGKIKQRTSNTDWILNQSLVKATGETNNQPKLIEANLEPHKWIYSKGSGGTENVSKEGSSKESMSTSASAPV